MPHLIVHKSTPENRQALIELRVTTSSPTLSLSASPPQPFHLILSLHIRESTQPSTPITICTYNTSFEPHSSGFDILARGAFNRLESLYKPGKIHSLGYFHPNIRRPDPSPADLKDRDWLTWLTLPKNGEEVHVKHDLSLERIMKYEPLWKKEGLTVGERWRVPVNENMAQTTWWCWGEQGREGDKERKFSAWRKGLEIFNSGVKKPAEEDVASGEWVLGEDPGELWFEIVGEEAEFEFVE